MNPEGGRLKGCQMGTDPNKQPSIPYILTGYEFSL